MKQLASNYAFDATAKTVTLNNLNIPLSQILMVAAKGKVLYSFADGVGAANYTQGTNSVLTLQSTTGLTNTDKLTIFYDDLADDSPNFINRYAITLNYRQQLTFDNVSYGLGTVLIPENRGRNNIEIISTQPVYAIFGEDATDIYNNVGTNFSSYCTTYGTLLSANVSYKFTKEQSTTGKVFLWTNSSALTHRAEVFASERSSTFINNNIGLYNNTLQDYALSANKVSVDEGTAIVIALSCRNVTNGTNVPYSIVGGLQNADLSSGSLNGNFTINNNIGTITLGLANDDLTEGQESSTITSAGKTLSIIVNDTSLATLLVPTQLGQTIISGTASNDYAGYAVDMNAAGDRIIVSTLNKSSGSLFGVGEAAVYNLNGGTWSKLGSSIVPPLPANNINFGESVAISSDGLTIAVGTPRSDSNTRGAIMVYTWNGSSWVSKGEILGTINQQQHGLSISINSDGTRLVTGSNFLGQIYIYTWNGTSWVKQTQTLNGYGYPVINSQGDKVATLTMAYDNIIIYTWNGTSWIESILTTNETNLFKLSINSDGTVIAAASPSALNSTGSVSIFNYVNNQWVKYKMFGKEQADYFGNSIHLNSTGDRCVVGASKNYGGPNAPANSTFFGYVRVLRNSGSGWSQYSEDIIGDFRQGAFGWTTAMNSSGNRICVGAPYDTVNNNTFAGNLKAYTVT
jgi:hypothetical protein